MIISGNNYLTSVPATQNKPVPAASVTASQPPIGEPVQLSSAAQSINDTWNELAKKYDVTNISMNELWELGTELIDKGLITKSERTLLILPADGFLKADGTPNLDANKKFNKLEAAEANIEFFRANPGAMSYELRNAYENTINVLYSLYRK